ncbi:TIGR00730 family Rossman fold protein [Croceicoccus ponticola]|uniref:AMP nucleosidase n=1 Tax=Croceicoccus ponticola TaxID=2217664 RepID=A0A437GXF4_9SPHN|nr:TIGR00730 family Rossman fold protein [Croceicoccus ponticola]RVQ67085.1 TIGR00730 family Rossman fold protein [Croceicoccus ponticola]
MTDRKEPPQEPGEAGPHGKPEPADRALKPRKFYKAEQEAAFSESSFTHTPQTSHPAYRLAFRDTDFLLRDDLRPVRFQLELLKAETMLEEAGVGSMLVIYGSARIPSPEAAEALLETADTDPRGRAVIESLVAKQQYYQEARKLAYMASAAAIVENGERHFVVCSGGGPSIMEAANRGAHEAGAESVGLNIVLPHEQAPNSYVTPRLSLQFHYFALRKMHFLMRARALAVFPGGFGTFDEFFETLTLVQTGKMKPIPIFLFGRSFWEKVVDFGALADEGVISHEDLQLFRIVDTAEEAWERIVKFYKLHPAN